MTRQLRSDHVLLRRRGHLAVAFLQLLGEPSGSVDVVKGFVLRSFVPHRLSQVVGPFREADPREFLFSPCVLG